MDIYQPNFEQYFPKKGQYGFKRTMYLPRNPVKGDRELENILKIAYDDDGSLMGYPPNQCIRKITKVKKTELPLTFFCNCFKENKLWNLSFKII